MFIHYNNQINTNQINTSMETREPRHLVTFRTGDPLLAGVCYVLIGQRFYTLDHDGNPRAASVFRLKN